MAPTRDPVPPAPPGLLATVTAAVAAGLTVGLLFGTLDAFLAGLPLLLSEGETTFALGCLAATVMSYSVAATITLVLAGAALHPILRRYCEKKRLRRLLLLGCWLAIWIELSAGLGGVLRSEGDAFGAGVLVVQGIAALIGGLVVARLLVRLPVVVHAVLRTLAVLAIAGGWFFLQGEEADGGGWGTIGDRNRDLFNVLILVADSLPAEALGCYGSEAGETPNIDALAERGVVVEWCYVPSPVLARSFTAITTGGFPRRAGGGASLSALVRGARPGAGGELKERDCAAATFPGALDLPGTGERRGGECEAHRALFHGLAPGEATWELFRADLHWPKLEDRILGGGTSDHTVRHASSWLAGMEGRRWIAEVMLRGEAGAPAVDAAVGELLELVEGLDALEETLVVLTAARGTAPDPANPLHASTLRVPLLLANTRLLPHGARLEGIVESVDVVPTVLDLLDLEVSDGAASIDGRSFLPGILGTQRGEADAYRPRRFAFAEDGTQLSILDGKSQLIASRELLDRDTLPADDVLTALLEKGTSLRSIDLAVEADEASRPDLAVVRTLWSELRHFQITNPERTRVRPGGLSEGPDPGRAEENDE